MPGFSMDENTPLLGSAEADDVPLLNRMFGGGARHRTAALVRRRSMRPRDVETGVQGCEGLKHVLAELEESKGVSRWYILLGLFAIFNHFAGGVISMMYLEGWSLHDAAYFCVVTLTTVGYGDLSPTYTVSKIFVIYYVTVSIAIVSSYLAYFVGLFIDQQEELILRRLMDAEDEDAPADINSATQCLDPADYGGMVFSTLFLIVVLAAGTVIFAHLEGFSWLDAIYATVISATTVGFGDLHPQHPSTKLWMTVWLLLGTIAVAKVIADFTEARVKAKQRAVTRRVLLANVESADLRELDDNQDGKVEWGEYLGTMLVKTGKITPADLKTFRMKFNELDKDTDGTLCVATCS